MIEHWNIEYSLGTGPWHMFRAVEGLESAITDMVTDERWRYENGVIPQGLVHVRLRNPETGEVIPYEAIQ